MEEVPPSLVAMMLSADLDPTFTAFARERFGKFSFEDIDLRLPENTFEDALDLTVGDRAVRLLAVGPAHTAGDAIVHVPDAGVVFTGDILFIGGTPIIWAGPVSNWLAACDRLLELGAAVLVPGHGPVTDAAGVADVKRYLGYVHDEARKRFEAGMSVEDAADDIDLSDFDGWSDPERIVVNVDAVYGELDPERAPTAPPEHFIRMARWAARH
jgi:glyoxylase-like metal-dependent hydrolase (beta-lactamase superfamily II)